MASVSPSPNSPPVINPPLPPPPVIPPSPPSTSPPASSPPPSSPPISSPPPTNSPPPSSPPISSPPPSSPPISSPPPSSPPTSSPPPSSPPTSSPPPSPPTTSPPPSSPPIPPASSPPPPSPAPPTSSPPPSSTVPPSNSPPPAPPPSSPTPPLNSPPPPPVELPSPPPSNPPTSTPPVPSSSPPPPSASPPPISPPPPSVPPTNSSSTPPPPTLAPPPARTPPSSEPPTNSSPPPPPLNNRPPPTPSTNSSSPPTSTTPPPFRRPPPLHSGFLTPPPNNQNNNDSSPNTPSSNGGIGTGGIAGITAVIAIVLLTVIITVLWCLRKRKKKIAGHNGLYDTPNSTGTSPQSDSGLLKIQPSAIEIGNLSANELVYSPPEPGGLGHLRSKFTYEDLIEATNGFSPQNLLGSGGFGYVYKGVLADGTEVAVKELKIGGGQGEREFSAEVEIISRIHHRHLVSLVGYCISENKRLLIYEYVPNNTLHFHLHVSELVLDWATRVKVASGAARGIAYLHEDCHPRIIHRDIKSSNILLDKNFDARVSDFGLAKLAADMYSHITTRVMGTFGYMAPEYASSGKLTEKSDVFSFGVVLLELITGRKPVDTSQPLGDESLVEWARPLLSHAINTGDYKQLIDPRLGVNFIPTEMFCMVQAAAVCVRHSAQKRPRMGQIVRAFESLEKEDLNNGMKVGESQIYNSAQQSAEIKLFRRMAFGSQNYSTDFFTQGSSTPNSNVR